MSEQSGTAQMDSTEDPAQAEDKTNVKETIESILVAFILAFIFRAFVVEAFVIPTGSMAPTLLGAHLRYQCPDCGWTFTVNYSARSQSEDEEMRTPPDAFPATDIYCPNCGRFIAPTARLGPKGELLNPQDETPVNYGDRILVLKYIYLLHPPRRWDVVVFKSPDDPKTTHYQQNFIKRLVGLPGEELMVLDGDIYKWNASAGKWEVLKKSREAQEALWRLVYDNDFHPHAVQRDVQPQWVQPWKPDGAGWDVSKGRQFEFDNADGNGTLRFDPNANSTTQTLTDYLVYDTGAPGMIRRPGAIGSPDDENANPVSDLKLTAYYSRISGNGALRMTLSRFEDVDHTFTAEFTPDTVRLIHRSGWGEITTWQKPLSELGIRGDRPINVEFANVDYRVTLRLNGREAFDPMDYEPNVRWLIDQYNNRAHVRGKPGAAQIEAQSQKCTLDHVALWRDVYYTNRSSGIRTATPDNPVHLGKGEYFVMGDNSAISKDARYWDAPINLPNEGLDNMAEGRVPEQFLLGKAVFVYWPAGFRIYGHMGIIPDFGDMRWIH
ncbi:MAG: S26 family signal peptidase [Tepidisphaeraceae bacterium]|jgi:signal peptidase I